MNGNKTTPNKYKLADFLKTLDKQQLHDTNILIEIMQRITNEKPVLWGIKIIGFGSFNYKYSSGREGQWPKIAFSPIKGNISLYITGNADKYKKELEEIGKHKTGKGCIYIKDLSNIDIKKLEELIKTAYDSANYF